MTDEGKLTLDQQQDLKQKKDFITVFKYNLQVSVLYLTTLLTYSKQACYFSFNAFKQQTDLRLHGENKATKKRSPNSVYHIQGDERAKAK